MKTSHNPRRSERGGPKQGQFETRRPASKVPLTPSVFDKKNWFVDYANDRAKSGVPLMDRALLYLRAGMWSGREEQGTVYLDVALAWDKPIPTRIGTYRAANITTVSFHYTPRTNSLVVTYDLDFDAERNQSALRAVVYGPQPRTLRPGTRILEEHARGPRGLEEAVKMARQDFEGRMVDGTIKVGTPKYGFKETPRVLLSAEETRELLAARKEAMRADDEGYAFVHKIPKYINNLFILVRPDKNGDFGLVYRDAVDELLSWYRSLPRQNPRSHRAKAPRRENGFLASLALVGIGMAAGVYVEEQKGVAARVRSSLKGKDKVAREQFDRLKRGVLEAKPRARATLPAPRSSRTDPAWVREESPDGKGYTHARTMKGTPYEVFERVYGKGRKSIFLDVGEAHERVNAPNGQEDGWANVAAAKRAAEALAGM